MTKDAIKQEYFEWIYSMLFGRKRKYTELLTELHQIQFRYSIPMDGNRESDGINLRYRFGYECGYEDYVIAKYLDISSCSVLEMMAALCVRIGEIMECDERDRTGECFCEMLRSLGIDGMDNKRIYIPDADKVISRFLDREYEPNGKGGLFTVNRQCDMRFVEIWYQAQYWMGEKLLE